MNNNKKQLIKVGIVVGDGATTAMLISDFRTKKKKFIMDMLIMYGRY